MNYEELRRIAGHYAPGEREAHTLQPAALVNEAFEILPDCVLAAEVKPG